MNRIINNTIKAGYKTSRIVLHTHENSKLYIFDATFSLTVKLGK